jgi:hypothetical protein
MKTVIKILVALVVLTACFNAGRAALNSYQFEDAVHEGLLFNARANDTEVVDMVMKLANAYDVPIVEDDIHIRQVGQDINITMSYTQNVVLVPGMFAREWTFNPSASTKLLTGGRRQ